MPCEFVPFPVTRIMVPPDWIPSPWRVVIEVPDLAGIPVWFVKSVVSLILCFIEEVTAGFVAGVQALGAAFAGGLIAIVDGFRTFFVTLFAVLGSGIQGLGVAAPIAAALGVVLGLVLFGVVAAALLWFIARAYELL